MTEETLTARAIWERLDGMTQDECDDWLEAHDLLIDDQWQRFVVADIERNPGTPLILFTDWPDGEHRVPMNSMISVRDRRG